MIETQTLTLAQVKEIAKVRSASYEFVRREIHVRKFADFDGYYLSDSFEWYDTVATFINGCERSN